MLLVKSFKITDGEGISEFLKKYRLASGANMLISNGEIAVPYEDGEPMNNAQMLIQLKEEKEGMKEKIRLVVHSQRVLEIQANGIKKELEEVNSKIEIAPTGKKAYAANKEADAKIKRLTNVLDQNENQMLLNQAELTRLRTNVEVYDEQIAEIEKE